LLEEMVIDEHLKDLFVMGHGAVDSSCKQRDAV